MAVFGAVDFLILDRLHKTLRHGIVVTFPRRLRLMLIPCFFSEAMKPPLRIGHQGPNGAPSPAEGGTGGWGSGLEQAIEKYQNAEPERRIVFTTPAWKWSDQPGYAQFQVEQIERAHCAGAHGLKVEKILGLYLRENIGGRIELCSELKLYRTQKPRSSNYSGTNSIKFIIDFSRHNPSTLVLLLRLLRRRALVYLRTWIAGRHFAQDCTRCIPRMPRGSWELN
jgi:hypothetical protein